MASVLVYYFSSEAVENVIKVASANVRLNAQTQAHDISRIFSNKVQDVLNNLHIIASSSSVMTGNIDRAAPFFATAQSATHDFTDSYFWVDKEGKLLWANAFSNPDIYNAYVGQDRSNRSYFSTPKNTNSPFVSAVIESVDGVPRIYYAYPIIGEAASEEEQQEFNGIVAAGSNLDDIGASLKAELGLSQSDIGMIDNNGVILYSSFPELVGKNYLGPELQGLLPEEVKSPFNSILAKSLHGEEGSGDFEYLGNKTTVAYAPVTLSNEQFAVLYVIAPHQLTSETASLLEAQRNLSTIAIAIIGSVAIGVSFLVLTWNKQLNATVARRTEELAKTNESLIESNAKLEWSNAQLEEANTRLTTHDKMQKEFVNIAAHELRTPIQPIIGIIELVSQDNIDEGKGSKVTMAREQYDIIARNATRLERLADDILQVARIESQRLKLQKESVNMNQKIANVISDVKSYAKTSKDIEIIFEPPKDSIIVEADKAKLFEVISNLIKNAIKFVDPKTGKIVIALKKSDDGKNVVVSVSDNGKGIALEIMPRLFQKFVSSFDKGGTGLGLYISKAIIEAHDGTIWAENNSNGIGATFSFSLPFNS